MNILKQELSYNVIQPFQLEASSLRGRAVRINSVLDSILDPHDYPPPMAHLVAEIITLSLLMSSMMKYEGIFTLQARGDGPVGLLVADVTSAGDVRGCAHYDDARMQAAREQIAALKTTGDSQNHLAQYLGKGHMLFTVDNQVIGERYQGVVELKGASMADCIQHYFNQSEQIGTGIKMAIGRRDNGWCAGAIMLQNMPEDQRNVQAGVGNLDEDDWRRSMILMDSCGEEELLSQELHPHELLTRLFHEEGVRVFEPSVVTKGCRCNPEKVEGIVANMSDADRDYMRGDDGKIIMRCEFCSKDFEIKGLSVPVS